MGATTSFAVWMTAICLNPLEDLARDRVDLIEVNHFYDEQGRLVFDQIIFYDWSPMQCRYQVRDWRLLKFFDSLGFQKGDMINLELDI